MITQEDIDKHYRKHLLNYRKAGYRFLKDHGWAEDAVQEAYLRSLKYRDLVDVRDIDGWMYTILVNVFRRFRQKMRANGVVMEANPHAFPVEVFPKERYSPEDLQELIDKVKNKRQRVALSLFAIKGYTAPEIEDLFDIPQGVTYTAWKRLKQSLVEE